MHFAIIVEPMEAWKILTLIWLLLRSVEHEVLLHLPGKELTTPLDLMLLAQIAELRHPGEVAQKMGLPPSTVSQILKRLEQRGLVARALDPQDLRRHVFTLTPSGLRCLEEGKRLLEAAMEDRLSHLSGPQRELFSQSLLAMTRDTPQGDERNLYAQP